MKTRRILFCSFLFCLCVLLTGCNSKSDADKLATFAEQSFLQQDFDSCMKNFREASGLSDLSATITVSYDFDYDYDKTGKRLNAVCHFSFSSDEIDKYATAEYYNQEADDLAEVFINLCEALAYAEQYEYSSSEGTVRLKIDWPMFLKISASSGNKYELSGRDWISVKVNGEWVYDGNMYIKEKKTSSTNSSNNNSYPIPNTARHTDSEAWVCAKKIVEDSLKSPSTAKFCSFTEAKITYLGDGEYMVTGWVEAQNSFGAMLRKDFVVTYTATEQGFKNGIAIID